MTISPVSICNRTIAFPDYITTDPILFSIAKRSFTELAVSLAMGSATLFFVATPMQGALFFTAIAVQTICNAALCIAEEKYHLLSPKISSYLRIIIFSHITAVNMQMLLDGAGQAMAAYWLFQNACPKIAIAPCWTLKVQWNATSLSHWGEKIGKTKALCWVRGLGPALSLTVSATAITIGYFAKKSLPECGAYLVQIGKNDFYKRAFYAIWTRSHL